MPVPSSGVSSAGWAGGLCEQGVLGVRVGGRWRGLGEMQEAQAHRGQVSVIAVVLDEEGCRVAGRL